MEEKRSYCRKEEVVKTYQETQCISQTAQTHNMTKGAVYQALHRSGIPAKKVRRCQEAAIYSAEHGIREAAEKYGMKIEALHHYRRIYGLTKKGKNTELT